MPPRCGISSHTSDRDREPGGLAQHRMTVHLARRAQEAGARRDAETAAERPVAGGEPERERSGRSRKPALAPAGRSAGDPGARQPHGHRAEIGGGADLERALEWRSAAMEPDLGRGCPEVEVIAGVEPGAAAGLDARFGAARGETERAIAARGETE